VAEWYDYGDFGAPSIFDAAGAPLAASAIGNARLYTGAFWDAGMRLYHLRARYLDPDTGRFTQRDPLGPWGDPLALGNPTTYAANNPWTFNDPLGLCAETQQSEGMSWLEKAKYAAHAAFDDYAVGMANWLFNSDGSARGSFDNRLDPTANYAAGFGDTVSFGATNMLREGAGLNDFVDENSFAYNSGMASGVAWSMAAGGAGAARAGARFGPQPGMSRPHQAFPRGMERVERSHWIPNRYTMVPSRIRNSSANMKPMWGIDHARNDAMRHRFIRKSWKGSIRLNSRPVQQWHRMPYWAQGASAGGAYGGASVGLNTYLSSGPK